MPAYSSTPEQNRHTLINSNLGVIFPGFFFQSLSEVAMNIILTGLTFSLEARVKQVFNPLFVDTNHTIRIP